MNKKSAILLCLGVLVLLSLSVYLVAGEDLGWSGYDEIRNWWMSHHGGQVPPMIHCHRGSLPGESCVSGLGCHRWKLNIGDPNNAWATRQIMSGFSWTTDWTPSGVSEFLSFMSEMVNYGSDITCW